MTGGGSGGHITPLLSLAHALKKTRPDCRIVYIGHKGDRFDRLEERYHDFDDVAFVSAGKFRRYAGRSWLSRGRDIRTLLLNARDFFRVFGSTAAAYKILHKVKPSVVFSKGGFVALPVGIAAKIRDVPIVTHDSDALPGLANRIIGRWAVVHATAMPANFYSYPSETVRQVGIPIDERVRRVTSLDQERFKRQLGLDSSSLVLLVAGGGLGSQSVNDKVLAIAPELLAANAKLHIVHIAGQNNKDQVSRVYAERLDDKAAKRVMVLGFSGEFYREVGAADLIIARAGATSLAEFAAAAKPVIVIPSPFLTGGHQLKNAEQLQKAAAVEVVDDEAPAKILLSKVSQLIKNPEKRHELAVKLGATAQPDAADKLAEIVLDVAAQKV